MTNLFTKIKEIIIADLNETLERKERQNPVHLLNQYLRQCELETEKVGRLVERQVRLENEFTEELNQATELAEKRKYQSEIAMQAGETELYQFASLEQQQYAERAGRLKQSLSQVKEQLVELERKYEEMKQKLKDMHLRRMELMGKENITRANMQMNHVLESGSYSNKSFSKFKDIEHYLDQLEKKVNQSFYKSSIDYKIEQLENQKDEKSVNLMKE